MATYRHIIRALRIMAVDPFAFYLLAVRMSALNPHEFISSSSPPIFQGEEGGRKIGKK